MLCVLQSGDGCHLASTFCKYDLRKVVYLFLVGQDVTSDEGNYLFRAV